MSRLDIGETDPATESIRAQGDVEVPRVTFDGAGLFRESSLRVTFRVTSVWRMSRDGCTRRLSRTREA